MRDQPKLLTIINGAEVVFRNSVVLIVRIFNGLLDRFEYDHIDITRHFSFAVPRRVREPVFLNYSYSGEINLSYRFNLDGFHEIVCLFGSVVSGGYVESFRNSIYIETNHGVMKIGIYLQNGEMEILIEVEGYDEMSDVVKFNYSREISNKLKSAFELLNFRQQKS